MKSKKSLLENCTLTYEIAKLVDFHTPTGMCKQLGITKQQLNYHLKLLKKEGIIEHPHRGDYRITPSSKKIIEGLMVKEQREMVRLEAMRYKFPIVKGLENLIAKVKWSKVNQLNTTKEYHTSFENHTARLIVGKHETPSLELYCNQSHGYDIHELMFEAKMEVWMVMEHIRTKYHVEYEEGIQTMQPEFAIPNPLAEAVLTNMGASQVRTSEAIFNRSKGRRADIEPHNLQFAHKVIRMPDTLDHLVNMAMHQQKNILMIQEHLGITTEKQMQQPRPPMRDFRAFG